MTTPAGHNIRRLWEAQLTDYESILHVAQQEEEALAAAEFGQLHETQLQRHRLAEQIRKREAAIEAEEGTFWPERQRVIEQIATTIKAVQSIDKKNRRLLTAAYETIARRLRQHKEGRAALHQYKPHREKPPRFFNRRV